MNDSLAYRIAVLQNLHEKAAFKIYESAAKAQNDSRSPEDDDS